MAILEADMSIIPTLSNLQKVTADLNNRVNDLTRLLSEASETIADLEISYLARATARPDLVKKIEDMDMAIRGQLVRSAILSHNIQILKGRLDKSICHDASLDADQRTTIFAPLISFAALMEENNQLPTYMNEHYDETADNIPSHANSCELDYVNPLGNIE